MIVPEDDPGAAAGTATIWPHEEHGEEINEIGWMVLPPYQGRGMISGRCRGEAIVYR